MEMIEGIPVDRLDTLNDLGVDLKLVAERGVEIFLKQVFIDNFFHADMHPGNIFIDAKNPIDPAYVAVDYAIVGSRSNYCVIYCYISRIYRVFGIDKNVSGMHVRMKKIINKYLLKKYLYTSFSN